MDNINYYYYNQNEYPIELEIKEWLIRCVLEMGIEIEQINYIFCIDEELLSINQEYLNHDYYTDIITFDLKENQTDPIMTDIFISLERVKENALINNIPNSLELKRVMIHGILHICGYTDKTPETTAVMREKENYYIYL